MLSYFFEQMISFFESLARIFTYLSDWLKFLQNNGFSNYVLLIFVCMIFIIKRENRKGKQCE